MNEYTETVGPFQMVARERAGAWNGVVWHRSEDDAQTIVRRAEGIDSDTVVASLRDYVAEALASTAAARGGVSPSVEETAAALRRVLVTATDNQRAMLKAHFQAPDRTLPASQLADAVSYKSYGGANAQYGGLGLKLHAELPSELPRDARGKVVATGSIASLEDQRSSREEEWRWTMHPHVAAALATIEDL